MDPSTLLEHRDFVRSVARALLRHDADVDDAVQETYVAALQAEPPRTGNPRPWLAGIARNVANGFLRKSARRRRRERAAARPESAAAESTAKLRWQQRVVEEVLALDAIYRDVLLLRYYEELPPRAIAAKLGVPVNTIRSRTRRGLELLRKKFDARYGRNAWSLGLAALFATPAAAAGSGKLIAAALVAVLAGTAWIGHATFREEGAGRTGRIARQGSRDPIAETAEASVSAETPAKQEATPPPEHFRGRILDFGVRPHLPIANATVHLSRRQGRERSGWDPVAEARTDADGRYSIPWDSGWDPRSTKDGQLQGFLLYVEYDGYWTDPMYIDAQGFREGYDLPVMLLDHPRLRFVRDGQPVAGVRISLAPPIDDERFTVPPPILEATTDADGCVELAWPRYRTTASMTAILPDGDRLRWPIGLSTTLAFDPYVIEVGPEHVATVSIRVTERDGKNPPPGTIVAVRGGWAAKADAGPEDKNALKRSAARPLMAEVDADGVATFRFPATRARHGAYVPDFMCAFAPGPRYTERYFYRARLRDSMAFHGQSLPTLALGTFDDKQPRILLGWPVPHLREENPRRWPHTRFTMYRRTPDGSVTVEELDGGREIPGAKVMGPMDQTLDSPSPGESVVIAAANHENFVWCEMSGAALRRCLEDQVAVRLDRHVAMRDLELVTRVSGDVELTAPDVPYRFASDLRGDETHTIRVPDLRGPWQVRFGEKSFTVEPQERFRVVLE